MNSSLESAAAEVEDLYNNAPCGYHSLDKDGLIVRINDTELSWLGYRRDEVLGKLHFTDIVTRQGHAAFQSYFPLFKEQGWIRDIDFELVRKDGSAFPVLLSATAVRDSAGNFVMSRATVYDMTERERAAKLQQRLNRSLKLLSKCNMALVHATAEAELLAAICQLTIKGGYRMAWVGYAQQDKAVRPVAQAGFDAGYLGQANITWDDSERGRGPTGTAIREGRTQVNQNFLTNPLMVPWRAAAVQHGYQSSIALPLELGEERGALTIYAEEPDAFSEEEVALLEELAADLAFGIVSLRTRKERDRIESALRRSLENLVMVIAATLEMRDPYTAGHQRRVAELSTAIAREMGLPPERVHFLGLAASIHDLGKIQVPVEILSKPGLISPLEMDVIKRHAQAGYEILKDIDFPFPLAQWIRQHHERLDGSGYPLGLKGEAILPESRILSVADVVEAIFSNRPYRAGRGIDAALQEISSGRGVLYDAAVVDACLRLFRERGFGFSS
ncbi:cyclic di-GMP phosphodiesterase response regulator RpfG [mine drainage metagenome]|uniref:Cyclic di-GMP phosphodiesterase response regulator RpfG n=1 Tax=mine drainage metagenome TaxID=410659 RepID=A0A1J5TAT5_9ZZZZ